MEQVAIDEAKKIVEDFVDGLTEKRGEAYANFFTFVLNQRTLLEAMSDMAMTAATEGKHTEEMSEMWDFISSAASTISSQFASGVGLDADEAAEAFTMANNMYQKINDKVGNQSQ